MPKNYNTRRIKNNKPYTNQEIAHLLNVNIRTVRHWKREGLQIIPNLYPHIILGKDLKNFLEQKLSSRRTKLRDSELYCVKCKKAVIPLDKQVNLVYSGKLIGTKNRTREFTIRGICPHCNSHIHRFSNNSKLNIVNKNFNIKEIILFNDIT